MSSESKEVYYVPPVEDWRSRLASVLKKMDTDITLKSGLKGGASEIGRRIGVKSSVVREWMGKGARGISQPEPIIARLGAIAELQEQLMGMPCPTRLMAEEIFGREWADAFYRDSDAAKKQEGGESSLRLELMRFKELNGRLTRGIKYLVEVMQDSCSRESGASPVVGLSAGHKRQPSELSGGDTELVCNIIRDAMDRALRKIMKCDPLSNPARAAAECGIDEEAVKEILQGKRAISPLELQEVTTNLILENERGDELPYRLIADYLENPCGFRSD